MSSRRAAAGVALLALTLTGCHDKFNESPVPPTPFNIAKAFNDDVTVVGPAGDGSGDVYVGGCFTTFGGVSSPGLVRLNADGSVNTAFNTGTGFDYSANALAPAGDGTGDLYVGGLFSDYNGTPCGCIIRLNADGTVDAAFNTGTGFDFPVDALAAAGDGTGDLYVGGNFTAFNGTTNVNRIARLNSNGTLDTGFDVGTGIDNWVSTIAMARDGTGDLYVGGSFTTINGATSFYRIARLNSNGTVDALFNTGTGFDSAVEALAPAGDGTGDLYVGGGFTAFNGTANVNRIARLNSDGTLDTGFDIGSGATAGFDTWVAAAAVAGDGTGDLYVGGQFTTYNTTGSNRIIRLNANGTVDAGFAAGTGFDDQVISLAAAGDGTGDLYAGGSFVVFNGTGVNHVARLNADGSVDAASPRGTGFDGTVYAVLPSPGGSGAVYVGGEYKYYNGARCDGLARLNANGTRDTAFDIGAGLTGTAYSLAFAEDGSGDLYVGGDFTTFNGAASSRIVRVNMDGSLDAAFAVGSGFNGTVYALLPAGDGTGDLLVGGDFTTYDTASSSNRLIRLSSTGTVVKAFDTGFDNTVFALAPTGDATGDFLVGGSFTTFTGPTASSRLIRLNADGSVDTAFAVGFDSSVRAIVRAADGSGDFYVGGTFTTFNATASSRLVRLDATGTLDAAFVVGATGFDAGVYAILPAVDSSGDIYVGGDFTTYQGAAAVRIIRLNADGSANTGFAPGAGFNSAVMSVVSAGGGSTKLNAGGAFTSCRTTTTDRVARLTPDGTPE